MAVGQPIAGAAPAQIAQQVNLSWGKAVEISINSVRIRFGRSLITASGIILAIAFLMSIWTTNAIIADLKAANDPAINLQLQRKGIDVEGDTEAAAQEKSKNTWLVVLSLLVCLVGITNAMLMSVTERFREIGTMKCLGALDSFIIKLFLLESSFQGSAGTVIGVIVGFLLTVIINLINYGMVLFSHLPYLELLKNALMAVIVGSFLSLFGGILPAYKAAKMEPVDAMRLEV